MDIVDIFDDEVDSLGLVIEKTTRLRRRKSIEVDLGHPISMEKCSLDGTLYSKMPQIARNYTAT